MTPKGTLYIVSMPIGNVRDLSARAVQTLQEVDLILAEDTRETVKLFQFLRDSSPELGFAKWPQVISYRDQNHDRSILQILKLLSDGKNLALVSDRGTPGISDPGYQLVHELVKYDYPVVAIPGASAVIAALSISGLPTDRFTFLGFLPRGHAKQVKLLQKFRALETTIIMFESPFRILELLESIREALGEEAKVVLVNDITKHSEKVFRGKVALLHGQMGDIELHGEWVVLVR